MSTNAFRFEHPLKLVQFPPPLPNKIQQQSSLGNIFNLNNIRGNVERRLCGGNLDDQTLTLSGTNLSIEGGNTVDLSALRDGTEDADADPANEIQTLSFNAATNELSIAGGNSITIPSGGTDADADPTNEIQTIAISGNELTLSNGGGSVTLPSGGGGGTDSQTLTFEPATNTLAISGGNSVVIPTGGTDADADPTNEIQDITFNPATGELSISDGSTVTIPLGGGGGSGTDDQTLTLSGTSLSIEDGNSVDLSGLQDGVTDADADPTNEIQDITFDPASNELSITGGSTVTLPGGGTDADADPTNEIQTIGLSGTTLTLSDGGGNVDLSGLGGGGSGTDDQTLTFAGSTLTIEDGNSVDLSGLQDGVTDADADPANELQTLSLSSQTLSLSNGGGTVDLAPIIPDDVWRPAGFNEIYYQGRVGIGTNSPEAGMGLHVADDVFVQSNRGALLLGYPDNGNRWRVATQNTGADLIFRHKGDGQNNYDTRFIFTQDGKLTINGVDTPGRLSIFQDGQAVGNGLVFDDGTNNEVWHVTHGYALRFHYGTTAKSYIRVSDGAYIQVSDRRMKEDITDLKTVTDRLLQLRPTTYRYRADRSAATTLGLLAQEVAPLFPELVDYSEVDGVYGINYSGLGVIAIKAIQEQQATIDAQSGRIEELEARLARLEKMIGK